jgi:hypothetical protein
MLICNLIVLEFTVQCTRLPGAITTSDRLDTLLVQRGLAESREKAKAMIMAGLVQVDKRLLDKPGHPIPVSAAISLKEPFPPYVSRGGLKLEAALDQFAVDVAGREKGYCCGCGIRPTPLENTAGSPR